MRKPRHEWAWRGWRPTIPVLLFIVIVVILIGNALTVYEIYKHGHEVARKR